MSKNSEIYHQGRNLLISFSSDSLVFCERKSDLLVKRSKSLTSLFCHGQPKTIAPVALLSWATWANCSWSCVVKSNRSELLKSLFKKERMSEEQHERFAHGHKKGGKLSKTYKKYDFFKQISLFYERFARITSESLTLLFFKEWIAHSRSLKWAKSERANSRPWNDGGFRCIWLLTLLQSSMWRKVSSNI